MSRTRGLQDLQTIDLQAAQATARLARIETALADDTAGAELRAAHAGAEREQAAGRRALQAIQDERASLKARLATEERRMYDGSTTSPKELQGLQREVEALRRRLAALDDEALTRMLAVDAADARLAEATERLATAEQASAGRHAAQLAERDKLKAALAHLERARVRHAPAVPPDQLALYEQVRRQVGVRAVAEIKDENCGACGIHLPRHLLDDAARRAELTTCGHCGRILLL
jgi:hypothetical protein